MVVLAKHILVNFCVFESRFVLFSAVTYVKNRCSNRGFACFATFWRVRSIAVSRWVSGALLSRRVSVSLSRRVVSRRVAGSPGEVHLLE